MATIPWPVGCNYIPATAVNQIEMWSESTFDPARIELELGWASSLGFNLMRIYLHDLVWHHDRDGMIRRMRHVLELLDRHGMRAILVLFDDCHRPEPAYGPQPPPVRGVHNCGWVHSPGQTIVERIARGDVGEGIIERLRAYISGVLTTFGDDQRVLLWDLYNEAGQSGNGDRSRFLLERTWAWARAAGPSQPLTACLDGSVGAANIALNAARSDVITFHGYQGDRLRATIDRLTREHPGRPLLCTEYMARELGTTFEFSLPIFRERGVGCLNWGLVAGGSQTHFNWETVKALEERLARGDWLGPGEAPPEPARWFHDIFRMDGTPYDPAEIEFIRSMTGVGS
ncbi:MAG: hypothetical protein JJU36_00790 [Phycisphaeraceae bacterium]|nr:hypothetical protein [Phycisphaeraceae bacterium]